MNHNLASEKRFVLCGSWLVWLLFLASFLMPVTRDGQLMGWQAFGMYLSELFQVRNFWQQVAREPTALLITVFPSTNAAMFIAPLVFRRWPPASTGLGFALVLGGLVPLFGFWKAMTDGELRVGYHCWIASIFLMAAVSFLCANNAKRGSTVDAGTERMSSSG